MSKPGESRGAVIALVGGVLGAVIGGGSSFAAQAMSNSSTQLQFTYTQERNALVQVATATDAFRESFARMVAAAGNEDPALYQNEQVGAEAAFLRFSQAYNEAYFVLPDTAPLEELYDAGLGLDHSALLPDVDPAAQDRALDVFDERIASFLSAARAQVRDRLSSVD